MVKFLKRLFSRKTQKKEPLYFLVKYRDQHTEDYFYFWTVNDKPIGPSFKTALDAQIWLEDNTEKNNDEHYL